MSDDISNELTFKREVESLLKIQDAYHKILIARTRHETYQYKGIKVIDIANWLADWVINNTQICVHKKVCASNMMKLD